MITFNSEKSICNVCGYSESYRGKVCEAYSNIKCPSCDNGVLETELDVIGIVK